MRALKNIFRQKVRTIKRLSFGFFIINLFVYAVVGWGLAQNKARYEQMTLIVSQNLAQSLELNITAVIDKTDGALLNISNEINRQLESGGIKNAAMTDFFSRQFAQNPKLDGFRFADSQGTVQFGTNLPRDKLLHISDRDYFRRLKSDPHLEFIISAPAFGRISGKWDIFVARRVNRADGSFYGVVFGVMPLDYFSTLFSFKIYTQKL